MVEGIGDRDPPIEVLPGSTKLHFVISDILVGAVTGEHVGNACAAGRGLEARVGGDHVVGEDAAVAPAANAKTVRVGNAALNGVVSGRQHVCHVDSAPGS